MKRVLFVSLALSAAIGITGCNVFDWVEPSTDHFDRCKALNDKGDYDGAIAECEKADPDGADLDVQLELADAHLAALGIRIDKLSEVFLNGTTGGTSTIVELAESIIAAGVITVEKHNDSITHATQAFEKFQIYGTLLVANDPKDGPTIAAFYNTLAGVSVVAVTMAYADIMQNGNHNDKVDKSDICNPANVNCAPTSLHFCVNDPTHTGYVATCEGMDPADAAVAADALEKLGVNLSALDLPNLEDAVNEMANLTVLDPISLLPVQIKDSSYKDDAGRDILRSIAR